MKGLSVGERNAGQEELDALDDLHHLFVVSLRTVALWERGSR